MLIEMDDAVDREMYKRLLGCGFTTSGDRDELTYCGFMYYYVEKRRKNIFSPFIYCVVLGSYSGGYYTNILKQSIRDTCGKLWCDQSDPHHNRGYVKLYVPVECYKQIIPILDTFYFRVREYKQLQKELEYQGEKNKNTRRETEFKKQLKRECA
jgi:hypothetical protein